jgi:hypothetical protein
MKNHMLLALVLVIAACSTTQKAETKIIATCTLADSDKIAAILEDKTTTGQQKLAKLASDVEPEVAACVLKAKNLSPSPTISPVPDANTGSGSGSGSGSSK